MTASTRTRIIASLLAMFKAEYGSTPQWLIDLHHRADDETLVARLANWCQNHPEQWAQHGIYVM